VNYSVAILISIPAWLAIGASIWEWDWYFNLPMAAEKVEKVGKKKARVFYFSWGILMLILAIGLGLVWNTGRAHRNVANQSSHAVGLTLRSTRTPPALSSALSQLLAISAPFSASAQAGPVSFIR
jgi:Na+/proline symporter